MFFAHAVAARQKMLVLMIYLTKNIPTVSKFYYIGFRKHCRGIIVVKTPQIPERYDILENTLSRIHKPGSVFHLLPYYCYLPIFLAEYKVLLCVAKEC